MKPHRDNRQSLEGEAPHVPGELFEHVLTADRVTRCINLAWKHRHWAAQMRIRGWTNLQRAAVAARVRFELAERSDDKCKAREGRRHG